MGACTGVPASQKMSSPRWIVRRSSSGLSAAANGGVDACRDERLRVLARIRADEWARNAQVEHEDGVLARIERHHRRERALLLREPGPDALPGRRGVESSGAAQRGGRKPEGQGGESWKRPAYRGLTDVEILVVGSQPPLMRRDARAHGEPNGAQAKQRL